MDANTWLGLQHLYQPLRDDGSNLIGTDTDTDIDTDIDNDVVTNHDRGRSNVEYRSEYFHRSWPVSNTNGRRIDFGFWIRQTVDRVTAPELQVCAQNT